MEQQAIESAISGAWEIALSLNKKILKLDPKNIPALNRLARAYCETGNYPLTKKTYQKVISLDSVNHIALKNLKRLDSRIAATKPGTGINHSLSDFIEEPRKMKIVKLVRLTSPQTLAQVDSGDKIILIPKNRFVGVEKEDGTHLGCLPEDLSSRLIKFIRGGNRYEAYVKSIDRHHLEIVIKEVARGQKFKNLPSF